MKNNVIVFSHLMKTGGTSLNQHLKGCYGSKMHIVTKPENLLVNTNPYNLKEFKKDLGQFSKLSVLSGHQVRPFIDFGSFEENFKWFIILRHPYKRFVSHYIQITNREGTIHHGLKINEWVTRFDTSNYMVRCIAGKEDVNLAKKILIEKFQVVGLTEEFDSTIKMMRAVIGDKNFYAPNVSHKNLSTDNKLRDEIFEKEIDFIKKNNILDMELYNFVKEKIWPKQLEEIDVSHISDRKKMPLIENVNKIKFQFKRYNYHSGKLTIGNLKYFIRNW